MSQVMRSAAVTANVVALLSIAVLLIQSGLPGVERLLLIVAAALPVLHLWVILGNGSERRSCER